MTALQLIQGLNNALFILIFGLVAAAAHRDRTRVALDTALFFGALAFLVLEMPVAQLLGFPAGGVSTAILALVVVALPYLMLRLLTDFTSVPLLVRSLTLGGLIAAAIVVITSGTPLDPVAALFLIGYFVAVALYTALAFIRLSARSSGVTRRRTQAVAGGMGLFGLAILVAGGSIVAPAASGFVSGATQVLALAAAGSWLLGFAPPGRLRRYWQEPELRAFLERASTLPRLPTTDAILRELERGAGDSFGARAAIGLYRPDRGVISFASSYGAMLADLPVDGSSLGARVFRSQR